VLVLDSAGAAEHVAGAADVLYDLLTDGAVARRAPRLLVAANKAGAPGARSEAQLRALLEAELERLRGTRGALTQAGDEGGALKDAPAAEAAVPLGRRGEKFMLEDSPLRVEWVACEGVSEDGAEAVREFIAEAASG
jgi:signal recognition particle receptor subunit beta